VRLLWPPTRERPRVCVDLGGDRAVIGRLVFALADRAARGDRLDPRRARGSPDSDRMLRCVVCAAKPSVIRNFRFSGVTPKFPMQFARFLSRNFFGQSALGVLA
jgi:hypothetical protein